MNISILAFTERRNLYKPGYYLVEFNVVIKEIYRYVERKLRGELLVYKCVLRILFRFAAH